MVTVKVKNSYNLNLAGKPSSDISTLGIQSVHGVHPFRIPHINPKLIVKEQDQVQVGSPLFFDKKQPEVVFVSPVSGTVSQIVFGPRRRIETIEIKTDGNQTAVSFDVPNISAGKVDASAEDLKKAIATAGLWGAFRAFPFKNIPKISDTPPVIVVNVDNNEPFHPESALVIEKYNQEFMLGLDIINVIAEGRVTIGVNSSNSEARRLLGGRVTHVVEGNHPTSDAGVLLFHTKTSKEQNNAWTIQVQDIVRLGQLFKTKTYPTKHLIALAGAKAEQPRHIEVVSGAPLQAVVGQIDEASTRLISGGVLSGDRVQFKDYVNIFDDAIHCLQEGGEQEFMSFMTPGLNKPSYSRAFVSALLKGKQWTMNTLLNGGERACIECGHCEQVCPVETVPQSIMKSIYGGDVERAMDLGLLDCTECGICTYVCPSKIELSDQMSKTKASLLKAVEK